MAIETEKQTNDQPAIRATWVQEKGEWYFSLVDVVGVLTESKNPTDYLKKLRKRSSSLAKYIGTNCPYVKMKSEKGKTRRLLAANAEGLLQIIKAIPSSKAAPYLDRSVDARIQTFQQADGVWTARLTPKETQHKI